MPSFHWCGCKSHIRMATPTTKNFHTLPYHNVNSCIAGLQDAWPAISAAASDASTVSDVVYLGHCLTSSPHVNMAIPEYPSTSASLCIWTITLVDPSNRAYLDVWLKRNSTSLFLLIAYLIESSSRVRFQVRNQCGSVNTPSRTRARVRVWNTPEKQGAQGSQPGVPLP